jgi:hypothetical protein
MRFVRSRTQKCSTLVLQVSSMATQRWKSFLSITNMILFGLLIGALDSGNVTRTSAILSTRLETHPESPPATVLSSFRRAERQN